MPSAKKVRWAQLRVGILTLVAVTLVGFMIFLLTGGRGLFGADVEVFTYMPDAVAMAKGNPVRLNGILVGKVSGVELTRETDPTRVVRLGLGIYADMLPQIPSDSQAVVSAENVLGTKYINIKKGTSPTPVKPGGELSSKGFSDIDDLFATGYTLLNSLQIMVKRVDKIVSDVESGKGSIGKFLVDDELYRKLTATVTDANKLTTSLNEGKGTLGRLIYDEALYEDVRRVVGRIDGMMQELQEGRGTAGKLLKDPSLFDEVKATSAEVRTLVADLNAGKGTAGKFLKSEDLHNRVVATLSRVDATIDKINSGQGTLGQLLINPQMYENISGATKELEGLMKDFRANPKKFLRIQLKLF